MGGAFCLWEVLKFWKRRDEVAGRGGREMEEALLWKRGVRRRKRGVIEEEQEEGRSGGIVGGCVDV